MTAETESSIAYSEPEPGIYPAMFVKCEDFSYDDKTTGEKEYRWRWVFYSEVDEIEFDTLTSRNFRPRTNALKLFTGILGRPPVKGDKPADHYGTGVQVIYGPNQSGKLTVTDVHREKRLGTAPFPVAAPQPVGASSATPAAIGVAHPDAVIQPMTALPNMAEPEGPTSLPRDPNDLPF